VKGTTRLTGSVVSDPSHVLIDDRPAHASQHDDAPSVRCVLVLHHVRRCCLSSEEYPVRVDIENLLPSVLRPLPAVLSLDDPQDASNAGRHVESPMSVCDRVDDGEHLGAVGDVHLSILEGGAVVQLGDVGLDGDKVGWARKR
jgi:hypothetical protein